MLVLKKIVPICTNSLTVTRPFLLCITDVYVCVKKSHTQKTHLVCLFPNVATPTFAICPKFDCFPLTHTHSLPYATRPFSPHTHVTETRCFFLGARRVGRRQGGAQRSEARAQPGKEAKKTHFFCLSLNVALPLLPYVQNLIQNLRGIWRRSGSTRRSSTRRRRCSPSSPPSASSAARSARSRARSAGSSRRRSCSTAAKWRSTSRYLISPRRHPFLPYVAHPFSPYLRILILFFRSLLDFEAEQEARACDELQRRRSEASARFHTPLHRPYRGATAALPPLAAHRPLPPPLPSALTFP